MKSIWLPIVLFCSGCAALSADPWNWLNENSELSWISVEVEGYGRKITYSIPDRRKPGGEHPRIWPSVKENATVQSILVPLESFSEPSLTLAQYIWDRWWGGFLKESGHDFSLNVRVLFSSDEAQLLSQTIADRLKRSIEYRREIYSKPNWESQKRGQYFFERYRIEPFASKTGNVWVRQNNPVVTADHVYYTIPITNHHTLEFSFFVRDKRYDWKDDPEWNARRWALVEEIMNTVRITPDPFARAPGDEIER